jgi:predicted nucleic acid-binding protein
VILLDTNVVSELMRPAPASQVLEWFAGQEPAGLALSVITVAEILYGLERLPAGRRRTGLVARFHAFLERGFANAIHPVDLATAEQFAKIRAARDTAGRPMTSFDALIAATARVQAMALATRNTGDFTGCGLDVVDPWA